MAAKAKQKPKATKAPSRGKAAPAPLAVVYRRIADLVPYARNARTHSAAQITQVAESIRAFGFTTPVLVDARNGIIAGHARVAAARELGLEQVPTIELKHLTQQQRRAYILADNKLALNAGWDEALLKLELTELKDAGHELAALGFSEGELQTILVGEAAAAAPAAGGVEYEEKFAVLVDCKDEPAQQATYDKLTAQGFTCRVLVN